MVIERPRRELEGAPRAAMKSPAPARAREVVRKESIIAVGELLWDEDRTEPPGEDEKHEEGPGLFLPRSSEEEDARKVAAQAGMKAYDISVSFKRLWGCVRVRVCACVCS